eukprot:gene10431-49032_t
MTASPNAAQGEHADRGAGGRRWDARDSGGVPLEGMHDTCHTLVPGHCARCGGDGEVTSVVVDGRCAACGDDGQRACAGQCSGEWASADAAGICRPCGRHAQPACRRGPLCARGVIPDRSACWDALTSRHALTFTLAGQLDLDTVRRDGAQLAALARDLFAGLAASLPTQGGMSRGYVPPCPTSDECGGKWACAATVDLAAVCAPGLGGAATALVAMLRHRNPIREHSPGSLAAPASCIPSAAVAELNADPALRPGDGRRAPQRGEDPEPASGVDVSVWVTQTLTTQGGEAGGQRPQLIPRDRLVAVYSAAFGDGGDEFAVSLRGGHRRHFAVGAPVVVHGLTSHDINASLNGQAGTVTRHRVTRDGGCAVAVL